jgi:hypothetical protein
VEIQFAGDWVSENVKLANPRTLAFLLCFVSTASGANPLPSHLDNSSLPSLRLLYSSFNFTLPDSFIPERWLNIDPRFASDKKDVLQPFSLGPRNCLGKK